MTGTSGVHEGGRVEEGEVATQRAAELEELAQRAKLRRILLVIVILCLVLGALGFAFTRWLATLPPGTLKTH